ncbi:MAG: SPOR domain-containing protein [Gammaproteobacteria bacterium]|nr:SPOR domain-containing protein [Gammaproteobacteria bacterium]
MPGDMKNRMEQPKKKNMSGLLWLFAGLSIGLFVAFLTYLQTQPKAKVSFSDAVNQEIKKTLQHKEVKKQQQSSPDKTVPKFDFYTILKDYEVFIPESEITNDKADNTTLSKPEAPVIKDEKTYFLQVGSFQANSDADKRRATLALLGITSSIQTAQINNDTWYRVKVGPIQGKRALNKVRDQLIENDIPTLIMVMK